MWETMSMLAKGQAVYSEEPKHTAWFESRKFTDIVSKKQDAPRVLNTHMTLSQLPPGLR